MDRVDVVTALALAVGLVLTGLLENLLRAEGLTSISTFVWPLGYGGVVVAAWYVWIRPLDIRRPDGGDDPVWEGDQPSGSGDPTDSE